MTEHPFSTRLPLLVAVALALGFATAQQAEVVGETAETRTVRHIFGETEIPAEPERVASLGVEDELVTLGVTPAVWAPEDYLKPTLPEVPTAGTSYEPNLEAVLAAQPDLILLEQSEGFEDRTVYEQLSRVAPTVVILWYGSDDPRDYLRAVGKVLGMSEEAEAEIAAYEARLRDARDRLRQTVGDAPVAFVRAHPREFRLYGTQGYTNILYSDAPGIGLGLTPPDFVRERERQQGEDYEQAVSLEVLPELRDAEYIFVTEDEPGSGRLQEMLAFPLFAALPAVRAGHVFEVGRDYWMGSGVLGHEMILEDVLGALAEDEVQR